MPEELRHWVDVRPLENVHKGTYWWSAHRLTRASEKYAELTSLMKSVVDRATSHPPKGRARLENGGTVGRSSEFEYQADGLFLFGERRHASFLGSEIVHHLRSSLDHLVYHAAWRDSGNVQKRTQFPVYRKQDDWRKNVARDLKGVSPQHVSLIEAVQPMNGVTWTGHLADMSNADKHRIGVDIGISTSIQVSYENPLPDPGDPSFVLVDTRTTAVEMQVLSGGARREVSKVFNDMFLGAARLLNNFLREEGLQELVTYGPGSIELPGLT